jgi:uncharacterized protein
VPPEPLALDEIRSRARAILLRHGAIRAGLLGSAARGQLRRRSDVDILVQLPDRVGLFRFVGIKQELESAIGRPIDLVEYDAIKPYRRDRILADEQLLL